MGSASSQPKNGKSKKMARFSKGAEFIQPVRMDTRMTMNTTARTQALSPEVRQQKAEFAAHWASKADGGTSAWGKRAEGVAERGGEIVEVGRVKAQWEGRKDGSSQW
jgi:hypothetical protein